MNGAMEFIQQSQEKAVFNSMVLNFPYSELAVIGAYQIKEIRQCLPFLLEMAETDLFYTNPKAIKSTLNFATSMVAEFDNIDAPDLLAGLLMLLEKLLRKLKERKMTDAIYPNVKPVIHILVYVSDLKIFSNFCATMCKSILLNLLKSRSYDVDDIDLPLTKILESFKIIQADKEVNEISEYVFQTFPFTSTAYKISAYWLLDTSCEVLKKVNSRHIGDSAAIVVKNIYSILIKVGNSIRFHSKMTKYQNMVTKFNNNLMHYTPKLIVLCCSYTVRNDARQLLDLVLHEFLNRQGVMARDIESITSEELDKFPNDIQAWPLRFSKTFFWICHMLYYNQRVVWTTAKIAHAIRRLIYTKMYRKSICAPVLKSICYIFPLMLQGTTQRREQEMRHLGEDLLNFLSIFRPLLDKILSLSQLQLTWILSMAPPNVKIGCIKFWLSKSSEDQLLDLKEVVVSTNSERYLIDAALSSKNLNTTTLKRLIDTMKNLNSQVVYKELPSLMTKHLDNQEVIKILIQICTHGVPSNKMIALKLYDQIKMTLIIYQGEEILLTSCHYISNMLNFYKKDDYLKILVCSDIFWIRFPISKIQKANEELLKAIMKLLNTILKYQPTRGFNNETVSVKLSVLLNKSEEIIEECLIFLQQLSHDRSPVTLDGDDLVQILGRLYDLPENPMFAPMVYKSLVALLKLNPDIINSPLLGMLIEERCYSLEYRRRNRNEYIKLVLFWIKIMKNNTNKEFCNLPQSYVVYSFIKRAVELSSRNTNRYLRLLEDIYNRGKDDYLEKKLWFFVNGGSKN